MGKGLLEVVLIAAEGLQDTHDDSAKDEDSYVMVQYMGQKFKSKVSHDVITLGVEEGVCELPVCKYNVVLADQTSHGEIRVAVKFTANGHQDKRFGFKSFFKNFLSTLACSMPV
ncbi:hypothetical protein J5N97_006135 [Dioscorea zingiberensis]|uniref:Uncharacterized protein n=1 Tax=Dioscorea zingiberensis TaxID=325984 RepID=A0A9D5DAD0_9LILI|nr:hypothetical protein J5N97_006135 [Dioscorea zingiberensis]